MEDKNEIKSEQKGVLVNKAREELEKAKGLKVKKCYSGKFKGHTHKVREKKK